MKKTVCVWLAVLLLLSACSESAVLESAPETSEEPTQEATFAPTSTPTAEPTPEPTAPTADLAYAGNLDGSVWHFYENTPDDETLRYIGIFYFSQDGDCRFISGYAFSEVNFTSDGSYTYSDAGELRIEVFGDDLRVSGTYTAEVLDSDTLLLTQTSEQGVFYYHSAGHQIKLEKGAN